MPISYDTIPQNWKQPLYWVEIDGSKAGYPRSHMRTLLVGIMLTENVDPLKNGTALPDIPIIVGRQMDADKWFGRGSELANMAKAYYRNNFANETWMVGVAEPDTGTAASGTVTIATPPTEAGTIHLYIGGVNVRTNVPAGATVNEVAASMAAKINENLDLPVTATALAAVITITCRWLGRSGNEITMRDSYYGKIGGELLPVGLTLTYSGFTLAGGVGDPDVDNIIMNLGETEYEYVCLGSLTDSTSLLAFESEWDFTDTGRWGQSAPLQSNLH